MVEKDPVMERIERIESLLNKAIALRGNAMDGFEETMAAVAREAWSVIYLYRATMTTSGQQYQGKTLAFEKPIGTRRMGWFDKVLKWWKK